MDEVIETVEVTVPAEMPEDTSSTVLDGPPSPAGEGETIAEPEGGEALTQGEVIAEIAAPLLPRQKRETAPAEPVGDKPPQPAEPKRDFKKEYETLIAIHPEVADGKIPDEVFKHAAKEGTNLLNVYEAKLIADQRKELDELRKEIAALKQNGEAFRHAPVTGSGFAPTGKTDPYALAWERA